MRVSSVLKLFKAVIVGAAVIWNGASSVEDRVRGVAAGALDNSMRFLTKGGNQLTGFFTYNGSYSWVPNTLESSNGVPGNGFAGTCKFPLAPEKEVEIPFIAEDVGGKPTEKKVCHELTQQVGQAHVLEALEGRLQASNTYGASPVLYFDKHGNYSLPVADVFGLSRLNSSTRAEYKRGPFLICPSIGKLQTRLRKSQEVAMAIIGKAPKEVSSICDLLKSQLQNPLARKSALLASGTPASSLPMRISRLLLQKWVMPPLPKRMLIEYPPYNPGLFSVLTSIVGLLDRYENSRDEFDGVRVDFGTKGLYYEQSKGPNSWEYYFERIDEESVAERKSKKLVLEDSKFVRNDYGQAANKVETLTRRQVDDILKRYIKIGPAIIAKVDAFAKAHFSGYFVIGIHYRGTDKISEVVRTSYDDMVKEIQKVITTRKLEKYKIFVATDEQGFLDHLMKVFPPSTICAAAHKRSIDNRPLHIGALHPAEQGEQALIDALLLSRSGVFLRTIFSNLGRFAGYFNPALEVIELGKKHKA